ncbi:MAG: hydrolase 1, exosortase A system-associated [Halioglobus sp.]|nr:hydrolase 1, exosortase A system-associated [Halioglobus sp.]
MNANTMKEIPLVFDCLGDDLIGIVHKPEVPSEIGVLTIVAGGPQYRAGVGRGMVSLARSLASRGVAVMRFDYRGLGDSSGAFLGYDQMAEDLQAAVNAFREAVPEVKKVVLWGGCDAASGAMIHGWKVTGVQSLVLGNPWVSTEEIRSAVLRKHYTKRLGEAQFWKKLVRFEYNLFDYAAAGIKKVTRRIARVFSSGARPGATAAGGNAGDNPGRPIDRMLAGLRQFEGPVLFLMSGRSLVSNEFDELIKGSPAWQAVYKRPSCRRLDLPDADQTFSDGDSRARVNQAILDWVTELQKGQ